MNGSSRARGVTGLVTGGLELVMVRLSCVMMHG